MIIKISELYGNPEDIFVKEALRGVKVEDTVRYFLPNRTEERK